MEKRVQFKDQQVTSSSNRDPTSAHPPAISVTCDDPQLSPIMSRHKGKSNLTEVSPAIPTQASDVSIRSVDSGYKECTPQTSSSSLQVYDRGHSPCAACGLRPGSIEISAHVACEGSDIESPFYTPPNSLEDVKSSKDRPVTEPTVSKRTRKRSRTEPNAVALQILGEINDLGEEAEQILKTALKHNAVDFRDSTDWNMLLAHLVRLDLVSIHERQYLNCEYRTNVVKANKFYFIMLEGKGSTAYRRLYLALKEEKTHCGHAHLVKIMTQELEKMRLT